MEDVWQVLLQYFFIDKFAGHADQFEKSLVAFNAVFMFLKTLLFVKCLAASKEVFLYETYINKIY